MNTLLAFIGRLLIATLFLVSGANKLMDISGTDAMIRSVGLPGGLALLTGLFEIVAATPAGPAKDYVCVHGGSLPRVRRR